VQHERLTGPGCALTSRRVSQQTPPAGSLIVQEGGGLDDFVDGFVHQVTGSQSWAAAAAAAGAGGGGGGGGGLRSEGVFPCGAAMCDCCFCYCRQPPVAPCLSATAV
jgi:hypothetical protein